MFNALNHARSTSLRIVVLAVTVGGGSILAKPLPAGVSSHEATVDGIKLHYLQAGEGPPILLLHG